MTILLTGTRAPATLDLARRLAAEGARVLGADSMRFPLGRFSNAFARHFALPSPRFQEKAFIDAITVILVDEKVDILWPTCEEIFCLSKHHAELSSLTRLLCMPQDCLERLHDKLRFAQWVASLATAVKSPASWVGSQAPTDLPLVWKPRYSRFAGQVMFGQAPERKEGWMAQDWLKGDEFCSWALCLDGKVQLQSFYRAAARAGKGASCAFLPYWSEAASEFVHRIAGTLQFTGSLAFDFIETRDSTYVIECNPRLTSGLHLVDTSVLLLPRLMRAPSPANSLREQRACQLFLPTLFTSPSVAGTSPDVVWSSGDPLPALGQFVSSVEFICRALIHRQSLLAATTYDIEFNGP